VSEAFKNTFFGVAVGVILYKAIMKSADKPAKVVEAPSQRRLIGEIRDGIKDNNWVQYNEWVNSSESISDLKTLTYSEQKYLASVFGKQSYDLEPKAIQILSRIGI